jgi:hypothetical protein
MVGDLSHMSPEAAVKARETEIAGWIDHHLAKTPLLPCRVDEMTEREAAIFKILSSHHGFLTFLRSTLPTAVGHGADVNLEKD